MICSLFYYFVQQKSLLGDINTNRFACDVTMDFSDGEYYSVQILPVSGRLGQNWLIVKIPDRDWKDDPSLLS